MDAALIKSWTTESGLDAVVALVSPTHPHYCGYIAVEPGSKLYEREYDSMCDVSVHGGLTYSSATELGDDYPAPAPIRLWWFGFDMAHAGDATDWEAGKVLIETDQEREAVKQVKIIMDKFPDLHSADTVKDLQYVVNQCESLATQLKLLEVT